MTNELISEGGVASRPSYVRHEQDEWVDEIRIRLEPRWKTSGMSGDEWRFSAVIEAYRKGQLLGTLSTHRMRAAAAILPSLGFYPADFGDMGSWPEHGEEHDFAYWHEFCFNPGCSEQATIEYKRLHHYCTDGEKHDRDWRNEHIRFCDRHKRRGDCGLNDADENYEVVALRLPDGSWKPVS